jgi:hypothetical protein
MYLPYTTILFGTIGVLLAIIAIMKSGSRDRTLAVIAIVMGIASTSIGLAMLWIPGFRPFGSR